MLTGNNIVAFLNGTTRKGTACIDNLTVKGYDSEFVAVFLCYKGCAVDVVNNGSSAQNRLDNAVVFAVIAYKITAEALEAFLVFEAFLP